MAQVQLTDDSRLAVRRLSEYYKEAPHRVRPEVDNAAVFFSRLTDVFARTPVPVTLDVRLSWRRKAKVSATAELAGRRLEAEAEEAPLVDARVRLREDLYRELELAGRRVASDLAKQLAALGPLVPEPEKERAALASPEAGRPGFLEEGDKDAIRPRPYRDELLSAMVPEGVFEASGQTRFTVAGRPKCYVDVHKPARAPKDWRKVLTSRFDLLDSNGWTPRPGSRKLPWSVDSIRFEGGWVLIGRTFRVVSVCAEDEAWFEPRADVILRSLQVN